MKNILSTLLVLACCLSLNIYAQDDAFPFITKEKALIYCPEPNELTFKAFSSFILSNGVIIGYKNGKKFSSGPKEVMHPNNMNSNNIITDAQLRKDHEFYGSKEKHIITCNYDYQTIFFNHYPLVLSND